MRKRNKTGFNLILGAVTCLLLIGISLPLPGSATERLLGMGVNSRTEVVGSSVRSADATIASDLTLLLQEAETTLMAQSEMPIAPSATMTKYVAVMSGSNVVPNPASTPAFGAVGAVLVGNRLVVRGDFSGLTSPLRDYATDPVNPPNPNITSGVHLHKGEAAKNGPFQYALQVQPAADLRSGRLLGEYTLTEEQVQALSNGMLYVDLHTTQNRAGELRGILKSYSPV